MRQAACQLEVAISDDALWVGEGDEVALDFWRELFSPREEAVVVVLVAYNKETSHAISGGIAGTCDVGR